MKIILAASGSGGHVFPCLTLGNYLKIKGHNILYLKIEGSFENQISEYEPSYTLKIKKNTKLNFKDIKSITSFYKEIKIAKNKFFIKNIKKYKKI